MIHAFEIVHSVYEKFRGLPAKCAAMNGKSEQWYASHGREPKTVNPLSSGNVSEVEHFMRYCRTYEGGMRGAGLMLSDRVHNALTTEFTEGDGVLPTQAEIHSGALDEFQDVQKWLINFDIEHADRKELLAFQDECDEACEAIMKAKSKARAQMRMLGLRAAK